MLPKMGMPPGGGGPPMGGPPRNAPPMVPDAVSKMDPECQEIYMQVFAECSQGGGAEDRRCMQEAMMAALEHQYSYEGEAEGGAGGPPMDDEELM